MIRTMATIIIGSLLALSGLTGYAFEKPAAGGEAADTTVRFWLESSLQRIFPQSPAGQRQLLELWVARGAKASFQVGFHNTIKDQVKVACSLPAATELSPLIRLVGLVPMRHFTTDVRPSELDGIGYLPGLVPEPLFPQTSADASPYETRSFWISLHIPVDMQPGVHDFPVRVIVYKGKDSIAQDLPLRLHVSKLVLQPRHDFHVTHWWRGEATSIYFGVKMFSEEWWKHTRAQMKDLIDHGTDVAFVQNFFEFKVLVKQPCQMLIVNETSPGRYSFDWSVIKRFTDMCKELGFKKFEWAHLWLYWGVRTAMHVYTVKDGAYQLLWDPNLDGFSDTYVNFLRQFLPSFHDFLGKEHILDDSYFHLSDEPYKEHIPNYKKARQLLHELAPWMKVMDALSDIEYGRQHLTDIPVPIISSAKAYVQEKIPHWVYFCTGPRERWLNRLFDTPLPKIRMAGWLFYHFGAQGFLHWGYNHWHILDSDKRSDPFTDGAAGAYPGIPDGDPFVVYPGPDGPYDSIRWEVFAESLQDYAILQSAGIDPNDPMLSELKGYDDFPKSETWIEDALKKILERADGDAQLGK